jgi:integrase
MNTKTLFLVDLFTGMRQGEILGLTWDCIDFQTVLFLFTGSFRRSKASINLRHEKQQDPYAHAGAVCHGGAPRASTASNRMAYSIRSRMGWQQSRLQQSDWRHLVHMTVYKNFKRIMKSIGLPRHASMISGTHTPLWLYSRR